MIVGLLVIGTALLALPGVLFARTLRAPAREMLPVVGGSVAVGILVVELSLALLALPTVLRTAQLTGLATVCEHAFGPLTVTNPAVGWLAALGATWIGVRVAGALHRAHRAAQATRAEPWLGTHIARGTFEVVTLPTPELLAVQVPGSPPQIILSQGLVEQLNADEVELVVRHEEAHLLNHHRRYLLVAAAIHSSLGWLAPVKASVGQLRALVEAEADEVAAGPSASERRAFSHIITRIACEAGHDTRIETDHRSVLARVARLDRHLRPSTRLVRVLTLAPLAVLTLTIVILVTGWFAESHHAVALGRSCQN